jgi:hypothetical protein
MKADTLLGQQRLIGDVIEAGRTGECERHHFECVHEGRQRPGLEGRVKADDSNPFSSLRAFGFSIAPAGGAECQHASMGAAPDLDPLVADRRIVARARKDGCRYPGVGGDCSFCLNWLSSRLCLDRCASDQASGGFAFPAMASALLRKLSEVA